MTWFHVSYRWRSKYFFHNLNNIFYDLFYLGPRNVLRWIPIIWLDRDFDYSYLLRVMEFKLSQMAKVLDADDWHENAPRYAKQVKTAALLCKRIQEDDYDESAHKAFPRGHYWGRELDAVKKQDKEMLGKLFAKYVDHWWG
jgi:hypothetical protein